ncbi:MAG: UDP-N-acetylmuramate dehydrogenase [bacterium]|nr:UDP-N-acetylmuramate dehydrogenase [bacterium]
MTNLQPYNTFQVSVFAKDFLELNSIDDLIKTDNFLILGLGANILFTKDFDGLVIKNNLKGKKIIKEDDKEVLIEVASGENWSDLVGFAVNNGWSGLEKMAFIPGTLGGALVGNIGAYGQTFEDIFISAKSGKEIFAKDQCRFGYRESAFKHELKNYFIENVILKLSKNPDSKRIAEEITALRKSKLPDWTKIPTAGSFFKNPFVTPEKLTDLKKEFNDLVSYDLKIPAGFLLEKLGWKGKRIGNVATHENHALIVINCGGATGQEILDFTQKMQTDVKKNFGIDLEPEVNII